MNIAVTGATGFLGRYLVNRLTDAGHRCRAWYRPTSDRSSFIQSADQLEWTPGELGDRAAAERLVAGCDAVVHAALWRPGRTFQGGEGDLPEFVRRNVLGTIELIEAARRAGTARFVFISTCAVHDRILDDRPLDEAHPCWAESHYGAHKAAVEMFIHAYGWRDGYNICSLRPCGIYGLAHPPEQSKWFELVAAVARGEEVTCERGGKEVHAADVAKAMELLLTTDAPIAGEAFNCYDRYISQYDVATIAKSHAGSAARIQGGPTQPKHEIETGKLRALGMEFGSDRLLSDTIRELVAAV